MNGPMGNSGVLTDGPVERGSYVGAPHAQLSGEKPEGPTCWVVMYHYVHDPDSVEGTQPDGKQDGVPKFSVAASFATPDGFTIVF